MGRQAGGGSLAGGRAAPAIPGLESRATGRGDSPGGPAGRAARQPLLRQGRAVAGGVPGRAVDAAPWPAAPRPRRGRSRTGLPAAGAAFRRAAAGAGRTTPPGQPQTVGLDLRGAARHHPRAHQPEGTAEQRRGVGGGHPAAARREDAPGALRQAGRGVLPYRQSAGRDPRRLAGAARTGQWASDRRGRLEARCGGRLVPRPGPDSERPRRYLRPQRAEGAGRQPGLAPAWRSVEPGQPRPEPGRGQSRPAAGAGEFPRAL